MRSNRRAALEGLPLYLIILIVIAAIVVVILIGWLSTLQHPAISSISVNVGGSGNSVVEAGSTGTFTANPDGNCTFKVLVVTGPDAVDVVVQATGGKTLSGATVTLTAGTGLENVFAQPSDAQLTDGTGTAHYSSLYGYIAPNNPAGGVISVSATYTSGGIQTQGSGQITVEPPSSMNC